MGDSHVLLALLHEGLVDDGAVGRPLPPRQHAHPQAQSQPRQLHPEVHRLLPVAAVHHPHQREPHRDKAEVERPQQGQLSQVLLLLGVVGLDGEEGSDDAGEEDEEGQQPEAHHDVGGGGVEHVVLVVAAVGDLVEEGHHDVDDAQHARQGAVDVEVPGAFELHGPAVGQEEQEQHEDGVGDGVQEQVHEVGEVGLVAGDVDVEEVAGVLEAHREHPQPEADLEPPLHPVVPLLLLLPVQQPQHPRAHPDQQGQQPAVHALGGGVVVTVALHLQQQFQLAASPVPSPQDHFRALSQHEVVGLFLLHLQVGLGGEGEVVLGGDQRVHHELLLLKQALLLLAVLGVALDVALQLPHVVGHHCQLDVVGVLLVVVGEQAEGEVDLHGPRRHVHAVQEHPGPLPPQLRDGDGAGVDLGLNCRQESGKHEDQGRKANVAYHLIILRVLIGSAYDIIKLALT